MGFGKDGKGVILKNADSITVGALADGAAIKQGTPLALTEDFRLIKADIWVQLTGTVNANENIYIGIADNELSVTEIAEAIIADGPLDRNDRLVEEQATRPVWVCAATGGHGVQPFDGLTVHFEKVIRWTFSNSEGFTLFAFNSSGAAITTGVVMKVIATYYGVWVQ